MKQTKVTENEPVETGTIIISPLFDKLYSCYMCTGDPVIQDWLTEALQMIDPTFKRVEWSDKYHVDGFE